MFGMSEILEVNVKSKRDRRQTFIQVWDDLHYKYWFESRRVNLSTYKEQSLYTQLWLALETKRGLTIALNLILLPTYAASKIV